METLIFNNKKKIVLSPHFDDLVLSLGGIALEWKKKNLPVEDWVVFSRSNYLPGNNNGKRNTSEDWVHKISTLRLNEEKSVTKELGIVTINLLDQDEALVRRGYSTLDIHEEGFPCGFNKTKDRDTLETIKTQLEPLLLKEVQVFIPLAIQEHTDHLIVKKAVTELLQQGNIGADIFFYEDAPYVYNASDKEKEKIKLFIERQGLSSLKVPINIKDKLALFPFYESQATEKYRKSILEYTQKVGENPCENLYYLLNYEK